MWRNNKQEQASKHVGGETESFIKELLPVRASARLAATPHLPAVSSHRRRRHAARTRQCGAASTERAHRGGAVVEPAAQRQHALLMAGRAAGRGGGRATGKVCGGSEDAAQLGTTVRSIVCSIKSRMVGATMDGLHSFGNSGSSNRTQRVSTSTIAVAARPSFEESEGRTHRDWHHKMCVLQYVEEDAVRVMFVIKVVTIDSLVWSVRKWKVVTLIFTRTDNVLHMCNRQSEKKFLYRDEHSTGTLLYGKRC